MSLDTDRLGAVSSGAEVIPVVDLMDPDLGALSAALTDSGFVLVSGHGITDSLRAGVRSAGRRFFALPAEVKAGYATRVGGRGWLPPGVEANAYAEGTATPADLKETFAMGADIPVGDPEVDRVWFPPNVWPPEVPELAATLLPYSMLMHELADRLLELCALALGQPGDLFTAVGSHPTWTLNVNRYPPLTEVGVPAEGQWRIGPHTDFGTLTLLDREQGVGGLQVHSARAGWVDAPWVPGTYTINVGDLLARWTGDRWRSARHRVAPPSPEAPDEDLVSLVFFYETDHDAVISPIPGAAPHPPVTAAAFLRERLDAISIG